jgi:hypothetical protein
MNSKEQRDEAEGDLLDLIRRNLMAMAVGAIGIADSGSV